MEESFFSPCPSRPWTHLRSYQPVITAALTASEAPAPIDYPVLFAGGWRVTKSGKLRGRPCSLPTSLFSTTWVKKGNVEQQHKIESLGKNQGPFAIQGKSLFPRRMTVEHPPSLPKAASVKKVPVSKLATLGKPTLEGPSESFRLSQMPRIRSKVPMAERYLTNILIHFS